VAAILPVFGCFQFSTSAGLGFAVWAFGHGLRLVEIEERFPAYGRLARCARNDRFSWGLWSFAVWRFLPVASMEIERDSSLCSEWRVFLGFGLSR